MSDDCRACTAMLPLGLKCWEHKLFQRPTPLSRAERFLEQVQLGGAHIGAARNWLKWNKGAGNGDSVTWGSNTPIEPAITAAEVDAIAIRVAEAVLREVIGESAEPTGAIPDGDDTAAGMNDDDAPVLCAECMPTREG